MQNNSNIQATTHRSNLAKAKSLDLYKNRSYSEENANLKLVAQIYSWFANVLSFSTQWVGCSLLSFLYLKQFLFIGMAFYAALAVGFAISLLLEVLKRLLTSRFLKMAFKKGLWVFGVPALLVIAISVSLSFWASLYIPNLVTSVPDLVDETKIKHEYDKRISDLEKERDLYRSNRLYKNRLSGKDAKVVQKFNDQILTLNSDKQWVTDDAKDKNRKVLAAWNAKNGRTGFFLGWIMLGVELLFMVAMWYQYRYYWNVYLENVPPSPENPSPLEDEHNKKERGEEKDLNKLNQTQHEQQTGGEKAPDNCLTIVEDENKTVVDKFSTDNDIVSEVKKLRDAIGKNWERAFTSKTPEAKRNNLRLAKERAEILLKYGIKTTFDDEKMKVYFSNSKTA